MRYLRFTVVLAALLLAACTRSFNPDSVRDFTEGEVQRVEPLSWWTGMHTPLQLLVQGPAISEYEVSVEGLPGTQVTATHKAESPNFLFLDVLVGAESGTCWLVFSKDGEPAFKYPYIIRERREGSAQRESYTTDDMIYLIMPDRFASATADNDKGWPGGAYDDGSAVEWKVPQTPDAVDRKDPVARHGGDIQGIIDHLDYIADLGATAVWNTPLLLDNQEVESYHGYACSDYYHIDPRFGDNALYKEYVAKSHEAGIKVIMDIVTNHCGTSHWWMEDAPFKDWIHRFPEYMQMNALFSVYMDPNAAQTDLTRQESGWFVPSMPDMNLDNPFVLKYFQQWAIWWVEYADLDGLRVDTYPYNEPGPMSKWCKAVREEYPNINIVGECWDPLIPQVAYWQSGNPNKNGFDSNLPSIMDFPLRDAIISALCEEQVWWSEGMTRVYSVIAQDFVYHDLDKMMIFFANHDHPRTGDIFQSNPDKMKLALALVATLRGIPQLYYGDEMMFVERRDCPSHDGAKRIDFPGGWEGDSIDLFSRTGRNAAGGQLYRNAADLHDYTARLFNWRKTSEPVKHGKTLHFISRKNVGVSNITDNSYSYFRYTDDQAVFVYINNTMEPRILDWSHYSEFVPGPVDGYEVISGENVTLQDGFEVAPRSAIVVQFDRHAPER
ncbi:MAG: glycoside hydrolase family 13 protein [Bacteroidales bacterium]|nr:glycoside hydrolase family 13 protein [Bacteroidales bacterium]